MTEETFNPRKEEEEAIRNIAVTRDGAMLHRYLRRVLETVLDIETEGALRTHNGRRTLARDLMRLMAEGLDGRRTDQITTPSSTAPAAAPSSSAAPAATATASPASTPTPTTSTPTAPSRPDWLPEKFFDAKDGPKWDDFGKHFSEVMTRDGAEQSRRLALPQKAEDVKIELPKEFQIPQGIEFKLDPAKPEYAKLQAAAVKHGLSQDAVSDLVGVYAETLVGSETTLNAAKQAEIAKLGANGPARVTALETFFTGLVGADKAKAIAGMMVTSTIVQALETAAAKFVSQGGASFSQSGRVAPEANTIPNYEGMTFAQRRQAQDDLAARRKA